jgi:hypothetical protein
MAVRVTGMLCGMYNGYVTVTYIRIVAGMIGKKDAGGAIRGSSLAGPAAQGFKEQNNKG